MSIVDDLDACAQAQNLEFLEALLEAARAAVKAYPGEKDRIQRGVGLILAGKVTRNVAEQVVVQSASDPMMSYIPDGECQCADFPQAPKGRCKHRFAVAIFKKVEKLRVVCSVERRDSQAAAGDIVATVCDPEYRLRNGGQFEKTAGR